ncbi:MAG: hypothetical protein EOO38_21880, partial [Cytophagaceae bacterium]
MTQKVKNINTENLHVRLNIGKNKDEISDLAHTFNNMLDRLETSFESQNNFVSNASHELSTPLTSIIGEAELALHKERSPERYREAMTIILKESERLRAIIQSLLNLAQTGFDGKKQTLVTLRADEVVVSAKNAVDRIYPGNQVRIDYGLLPEDDDKLKIKANEPLLILALTNIMLNACKYSDNQPVVVAIGSTNTKLVIIIRDKGIGIPKEELQYIYDPFFRASNTGEVKGYGIGLPLARNIIRIHQGELRIDRLDRADIQTLFKLVRLSGGFDHTTYILAFDDEVVAEALGEAYGSGDPVAGRRFLEKIVQVPLHLPPASPEKLRQLMFSACDRAIRANGLELADGQNFELGNNLVEGVGAALKTPRQTKLFDNAITFAIPLLKGEVRPVDQILIEAIRIFYPTIYQAVRNNPTKVLSAPERQG